MALTQVSKGLLDSAAQSVNMKNRIINGAMVIAQRGTSATVNDASAFYTTDRWECQGQSGDGVYTIAQSSTAPTGFNYSLLATVTTADSSIGATQSYSIRQKIEGYNIADLGWGGASAKTVTLSFWVQSSLTGTFGGALINGGFSRSYPFSYTISAANTWEQKTVTITGDTTGTWSTDNSTGIVVSFSMGAGSSRLGTAGAWVAANNQGATGQTNIIATNGATFYLTGCQLEVGSTASSFDYRPYGTELALCQRYLPAWSGVRAIQYQGQASSSTNVYVPVPFPVTARAAPTGVYVNSTTNWIVSNSSGSGLTVSAITFTQSSPYNALLGFTTASGLTAGNASFAISNDSATLVYFTGCEL